MSSTSSTDSDEGWSIKTSKAARRIVKKNIMKDVEMNARIEKHNAFCVKWMNHIDRAICSFQRHTTEMTDCIKDIGKFINSQPINDTSRALAINTIAQYWKVDLPSDDYDYYTPFGLIRIEQFNPCGLYDDCRCREMNIYSYLDKSLLSTEHKQLLSNAQHHQRAFLSTYADFLLFEMNILQYVRTYVDTKNIISKADDGSSIVRLSSVASLFVPDNYTITIRDKTVLGRDMNKITSIISTHKLYRNKHHYSNVNVTEMGVTFQARAYKLEDLNPLMSVTLQWISSNFVADNVSE
jgi:hypothetical protein